MSSDVDVDLAPTALKRRSVRGAAVTLVGQVVRVLFQFGAQLYLAHLISPSAFGLIAMVAPILRFIQLFNTMGLLEAVVQRPTLSQEELSSLFWINLACSILLALMFASTGPLAAWFYGEPRLQDVMLCLSFILFLAGLAAQPMALLNRKMRFLPLTVIDVLSTVGAAVVGTCMAMTGFSYWALVGMQLANSVILCVMAWVIAGWRPSWPRWEPGILPLLGFGGNVTAISVLSFFAESFDKVLLGAAAGAVALGLYDRSSTFVTMATILVMTTFGRIAVPLLSRLADARERYRLSYLRLLQTALLLVTPGLVCVIVLPKIFVSTLLGPAWLDAIPIMQLLAVGAVVTPVVWSTSWLFISQNRTSEQLLWGSAGFAAIAASFFVGLPWGAVGLAVAWSACSWLVQAPLILWASTRRGPVPTQAVVTACVPIAAGALLSGAVLWLIKQHASGIDGIGGLLAALVVSYGVHGLVLAVVPSGRLFLRDAWALRST